MHSLDNNLNFLRTEFSVGLSSDFRSFVQEKHKHEARLHALGVAMIEELKERFNLDVEIVGSVRMELVTPQSDLDIACYLPSDKKNEILAWLNQTMEFRGERPATESTTRFLFCKDFEGINVDINVLTKDDLNQYVKGLEDAVRLMTETEKYEYAFLKYKLSILGEKQLLEDLKLEPYIKFCPGFIWLRDSEIVEFLRRTQNGSYGSLDLE